MFFLVMRDISESVNEDLFERMINDYRSTLLKIAIGIVGNKEDAEDIIQETFLKVYRKIEEFNKLESNDLIALLVIYMKNTAKDHLRKEKRRLKTISQTYEDENGEEQEYDVPDDCDAPDEVIIRSERSQQIAKYINLLNKEQRRILLLKYEYGYKENEIAKVLMISENSVSSRINRAKDILRKIIKTRYNKSIVHNLGGIHNIP